MFENILVPYDFGPAAENALETAVALAGERRARLTVLNVCEVPAYAYEGMLASPVDLLTPVVEIAEERVKELVASVRERVPQAEGVVQVGTVADRVLAEAEARGCDLIVIGTHGRRGIAHAALGSVAEKIVRLSPVPVLAVHARKA